MNRRVVIVLVALALLVVVTGVLAVGAAAQALDVVRDVWPGMPGVHGIETVADRVSLAFGHGAGLVSPGEQVLDEPGAVVVGLVEGGPAVTAGVVRGDIILAAGDKEVNDLHDLEVALAGRNPGDAIALRVRHGDAERTLSVTLGDNDGRPVLGLLVYPGAIGVGEVGYGNIMLERFLGPDGAQIASVIKGSPAAKAGLAVGEAITDVDGKKLDRPLAEVIADHKPGDTVVLTVAPAGDGDDEIDDGAVEVEVGSVDDGAVEVVVGSEDAAGKHEAGAATGGGGDIGEDEVRKTTREVTVVLGEHPDKPGTAYLGITVAPVRMVVMARRGVADPAGDIELFGRESAPFELPDGVTQAFVVGNVVAGGPAEAAGLQDDDLVTAVDGRPVEVEGKPDDLVAARKVGDPMVLTVVRRGEEGTRQITVTLGEDPDDAGKAWLGIEHFGAIKIMRGGDEPKQLRLRIDSGEGDILPFGEEGDVVPGGEAEDVLINLGEVPDVGAGAVRERTIQLRVPGLSSGREELMLTAPRGIADIEDGGDVF